MILGIISLVLLITAIVMFKRPIADKPILVTRAAQGALFLLGFFLLASRSFVIVDANEIGHLKLVYSYNDLPPGKIIATEGEKGKQARILGPGFHVIPLVRILYEVEFFPVISIPEGSYGLLEAKDGTPLRADQFIAEPWKQDDFKKMLDAHYFLTEGNGQKGPQFNVLTPGEYRINRYLFDVKMGKALDIPTGHVAVIRSNVQSRDDCPTKLETHGATNKKVATPIVPKGCIGVWDEVIPPGKRYINEKAWVATIVPTRVQAWEYKGGYTKRTIDLRLDDNGQIHQNETTKEIPVPEGAADQAINVRVQGWNVPVELRIIVQVHPEKAPIVVATVGTLDEVEDKIITPAVRDILRTIGGHDGRKVLDLMNKRDEIVRLVEEVIAPEGEKAGVTIQEVRMGEPYIPPEFLVAAQRENLAYQLKQTYIKEQEAQNQRIAVERERATADQQTTLVTAEIAKQAATHRKQQLQLEGEGEKLKLVEIAKGQQAQADVLGKERAMQLQALEKTLAAAVANPAIVKVPTVLVTGSGTGLEGAAAVLGSSNLIETMRNLQKPETPTNK